MNVRPLKDYLGNEIFIGDKVICVKPGSKGYPTNGFLKGVITSVNIYSKQVVLDNALCRNSKNVIKIGGEVEKDDKLESNIR